MQLLLSTPASLDGVLQQQFVVDGEVPGVLWSPDDPGAVPAPLVLMGHGGGLSATAPGVVVRARHLVQAAGYHVASIDAPGHGDRPRSADDARWVDRLRQARADGQPLGAIVSAFNGSLAERAVPEWRAALDALQALPQIGDAHPVGYTGMTLGSEIGIRLIAAEPRIRVAVLGGAFASDALLAAARTIEIPVRILLQWDDREIDRESSFALFEAFGSAVKTIHANPGPHQRVPWFEIEDSARFLMRHLEGAEVARA